MSTPYPIDGSRDALWMATAVPAPETSTLHTDLSCDVTIIGGGLTGLNAAVELAKNNVSVCVVDAAGLGFGASGRSGGQVNIGLNLGPTALLKKFGSKQGEQLIHTVINTPANVFNLIEEHKLDCDPVQNGWIQGAIDKTQLNQQAEATADYASHGCHLELLDADAIAERSGTERYRGGLFAPMSGSLHPMSYTRELARTALNLGAKIFTHTAVEGLQRAAGRWQVKTADGEIDSEQVLVCTNGYTGDLVTGLAKTLVPVRSVLIASEPLSDNLRKSILPNQVTFVDKRRLILYFRYDRDGRLCVGDHGPMRDAVCLNDFNELKRRVLQVFPQLADTRWDYHWGGRVAMTKDTLPFLHEIEPGLTAGMGYNGRGIGMGSMMGRTLAQRILHPENALPGFPVTTPKRFAMHKFHSAGVSMTVKWLALRDHLQSLST